MLLPGAPPLPFFVYGTLRPGGRNHTAHLAGRLAVVRGAVLEGAALYRGPGYPYAVTAPGHRVLGDLLTVRPEYYRRVLGDLDRLEDCRPDGKGEYVRLRLAVTAEDGEQVPAWVYLAGPPVLPGLLRSGSVIASGDWLAR